MGNGVTILIKNDGFHEKQRRLYSGAPKIRQMLDVSNSCKVAMFLGGLCPNRLGIDIINGNWQYEE